MGRISNILLFLALLCASPAIAQNTDSIKISHVKIPWYSRINLYGDFSLNHYKAEYQKSISGQISGDGLVGFDRQSIGTGFEVNLNYDAIRRWGLTVGIGIGYRSFNLDYIANPDSVVIVNPNSRLKSQSVVSRMFEIPIYVSYTFFRHLSIGLRSQIPFFDSNGIVTEPNSPYSGFPEWGVPFNFEKTGIEMFIGYRFKVGGLEIIPTFSLGGPAKSIFMHLYTDFGIRLSYIGQSYKAFI